jgi:hypothetical protein
MYIHLNFTRARIKEEEEGETCMQTRLLRLVSIRYECVCFPGKKKRKKVMHVDRET